MKYLYKILVCLMIAGCGNSTKITIKEKQCQDINSEFLRYHNNEHLLEKDSAFVESLLRRLGNADSHCYPQYDFLKHQLWILHKLGRYDEIILLLFNHKDRDVPSPFGPNYEILVCRHLQYKKMNDINSGRKMVSDLVRLMKLSFALHYYMEKGTPIDSVEMQYIDSIIGIKEMRVVNPDSYYSMIYYYPTRALIEPQERLIQEIEEIKFVNEDIPLNKLKHELKQMVKEMKPL